jgi:DNA-binding NtrC family response regulator
LVDGDPLQAHLRTAILERQFVGVRRVNSAAEALCLVEQPQFTQELQLVISGHHMPGIAGPAFVAELRERLPKLQVLVLGNDSEVARDYEDSQVCFLPVLASYQEMLNLAGSMLAAANGGSAAMPDPRSAAAPVFNPSSVGGI